LWLATEIFVGLDGRSLGKIGQWLSLYKCEKLATILGISAFHEGISPTHTITETQKQAGQHRAQPPVDLTKRLGWIAFSEQEKKVELSSTPCTGESGIQV
jgi:hypothetical protein